MAADLLTLKFRDAFGDTGSYSMYVQGGLGPANVELLELIQAWLDLSDCVLVDAKLAQDIDISGLTNPAAVDSGSSSKVRTQAIMQAAREDGTGYVRISVPGPKDVIFATTGQYAHADVNPAQALVVAFNSKAFAAPIAGEVWRSAQEDPLDFDKGWKKGLPHS